MKCVKVIIAILILTCGAFLAYIYSGVANVAATAPDSHFSRWVLGTVRERSIASRVAAIQAPPLTDPKMIEAGAARYDKLCAGCHLAPGMESSDLRTGLNPRPPMLARAVPYFTPAKLFWITKNGIKMTGMPSWGRTQNDARLWDIVAFLKRLPSLTPAEYQAMKQASQAAAAIAPASAATYTVTPPSAATTLPARQPVTQPPTK
ncbi:MAG: cytochrome c [Gammaproteobacteria bacterium]